MILRKADVTPIMSTLTGRWPDLSAPWGELKVHCLRRRPRCAAWLMLPRARSRALLLSPFSRLFLPEIPSYNRRDVRGRGAKVSPRILGIPWARKAFLTPATLQAKAPGTLYRHKFISPMISRLETSRMTCVSKVVTGLCRYCQERDNKITFS